MKAIWEIYQKSSLAEQAVFEDVLEEFHNALFHRRTISETFAWIQVLDDLKIIWEKAEKYISTIKNWQLSKKEKEFFQGITQSLKSSLTEDEKHSEDSWDQEKQEESQKKEYSFPKALEEEMREFFLKYYFFSCQKNVSEFLKTETGAKVVNVWWSHFQEAFEDITKERKNVLKTLSSQWYIEEVSRKKFLQEFFDLLDDKQSIPRRFRKLLLEFSFDVLFERPSKFYEFRSPKKLLNLAVEKFSFVDIYIPNPIKIHKLYEEIHGRDEKYNTIQFFENGHLIFRTKTILFRERTYAFHVLRTVFILWKEDFKSIFSEYNGFYDDDRYYEEKHADKIEDAIHGINKRLKTDFPKEKQFFGCEKGSVVIKIWKK